MPDYLMNFSVLPNTPLEIREDGLSMPSLSIEMSMPWNDIANEYEGVVTEIRKDGIVFNITEATAAKIRAAWSQPLLLLASPVKTTLILTLTRLIEAPKPIQKIAYLVSYESLGCIPDSQYPAFSFKEAKETARSFFANEQDEQGQWAWSVNNSLTAREVIDSSPWGCVFAEENREHGLYRVIITAVEDHVAKDWLDD